MANIDATSSMIGFFVNSAAVATQRVLIDGVELKELRKALSKLLMTKTSDPYNVKETRKKLILQLIPWILLLHVINLAILTAAAVLLLWGPEKLANIVPGFQAYPLSTAAKIALWLWLLVNGITYLSLCFMPTVRDVQLIHRAGKWLRDNSSPPRS
ncbi:MAG TPA: hypothetical protein VGO68_17410 [Pyrinomonadaceae bacterium]|nr:hypothetical protein [Pyrinomonadaceae bacterium]